MNVDHHQAVEHRDARQGDEADAGGDRQRNVAQPQRDDSARQRQRHAAEDGDSVAHRTECAVKSSAKIMSSASGTTMLRRCAGGNELLELPP